MIGLSLSFCVLDIVRGKVQESEVEKIVASTAFETDEDFETLLRQYVLMYWFDYSRQAPKIARRLRSSGKIEQPRLSGAEIPNIARGHWVKEMNNE